MVDSSKQLRLRPPGGVARFGGGPGDPRPGRQLRLRRGRDPVAGPVRERDRHRPRRGGHHDRAVGLGEDDPADADRGPPGLAGGEPRGPGARACDARRLGPGRAAPGDRLHLPAPQPVQLALGDRERADGDRPEGRAGLGDEPPGRRPARRARAGRPARLQALAPLRRPAAARGDRPGAGQPARAGPGRRANRGTRRGRRARSSWACCTAWPKGRPARPS